MLALKIGREPEWVDLTGGVHVKAAPVTSAVMMAVRSDLAVSGVDLEDRDQAHVALVKAVAQRVITDWKGVGDTDGNPIPVTAKGIDALMDLHRIFAAFDAEVFAPYLLVQSEKNAFAPSPNGTSAGAETTAQPATASAESARASKTGRKPRKAGRSGT